MAKQKDHLNIVLFIVLVGASIAFFLSPELITKDLVIQNNGIDPDWIYNGPIKIEDKFVIDNIGYIEGSQVQIIEGERSRTLINNWVYRFENEAAAKVWANQNRGLLIFNGYTELSNQDEVDAECFIGWKDLILADKTNYSCYKGMIGFEVEVLSKDINSKELANFFARRVIRNINELGL